MPTEPGAAPEPGDALRASLDRLLDGLPAAAGPAPHEQIDARWLAVGLRIGVERPAEARRLLEDLAGRADPRPVSAPAPAPDDDVSPDGAGPTDGAAPTDGDRALRPVPPVSSLLARSAGLPLDDLASLGPDVVFGWAAGLAPATVLAIGTVVRDMLDAGASKDVGRGFGLAWDAGIRLPHRDLDAMLRAFTSLEVVIGGVLAGRDLRIGAEPASGSGGLGGLLGAWKARRVPGEAQASDVLDRAGEDARRGLVACWNAWMAMRYGALLQERTFELLVRPWVTVVGPLPPPAA